MVDVIFYPIEHDGTGFSGTTCEYRVRRRRPLIPSNPKLGYTMVSETCGKTAGWWTSHGVAAPSNEEKRVYCTQHKRLIESPPKPKTAAERVAAQVRNYERQCERSVTALREMQGNAALRQLASDE